MTILLAIEKLASQDAKTLKGVLTTMKQEIKVVAIMLAMTLVFLCGVAVGTVNGGININGGVGGGSTAVGGSSSVGGSSGSTTTTPPQNSQSLATQPGTEAEPQEKVTTSSGLERPADTDYAGMCEAYNKAVNDYRSFKGKVTLNKTDDIQIKAKDLPKLVEGVVNGVVERFVGVTTENFTFENGLDVNDPNRHIDHKMIPGNRAAAVTTADISAATIVENSDGGYTITLTFVAETSTFDGTNSTDPVHHMTAMDPLNLGTLDISPLTINSATMTYPGAVVEMTVDGQGRLVKLFNTLPLEGKGAGGYKALELELGLEGKMLSTYEMTYA